MISALRQKKDQVIDAIRQFVGVREEVAKLASIATKASAMAIDNKMTQRAINEEIGDRLRRVEKCILLVAKEVEKRDVAQAVVSKG